MIIIIDYSYEMLIGIPPFYNKNKHQMYYLIQHASMKWPDKVKHGIEVSDEAKDLVTKVNKITYLNILIAT